MDFSQFKAKIYKQFALNLDGYKEKQLKRRIDSLMQSQGFKEYHAYFQALISDEEQLSKFLDKVTINVSEFFRNPEIFAVLEKKILPMLLAQKSRLKIWSAACSNGCEPYSVAIIMDEIAPNGIMRLEATDIDKKILEVAKAGRYDLRSLKNVSPQRLAKYFRQEGEQYVINDAIKRKVHFRYHDLLVDSYGTGYDLIICRNVTIYFTPEMQDRLYANFYEALAPGGVLFIGATENMLKYREFGYEKISSWFYQKPERV